MKCIFGILIALWFIASTNISSFFPVWRYASAGTSYGPMSVCVFHKSVFSIERNGQIGLVFGMEACFDQSCTVL